MDFDEVELLMLSPPAEMTALLKRPTWHAKAACRGLAIDTFFTGSTKVRDNSIEICRGCPVKSECLNFALEDPTLKGVWGGTSARQRAVLRRHAS